MKPVILVSVLVVLCAAGWLLNDATGAFDYQPTHPCTQFDKTRVVLIGDSTMREVFFGMSHLDPDTVKCPVSGHPVKRCPYFQRGRITYVRHVFTGEKEGLPEIPPPLKRDSVGDIYVYNSGLWDLLWHRNLTSFARGLDLIPKHWYWLPIRHVEEDKLQEGIKAEFITNGAISLFNRVAKRRLESRGVKVLAEQPLMPTGDGIHFLDIAPLSHSFCYALANARKIKSEPRSDWNPEVVLMWTFRNALALCFGFAVVWTAFHSDPLQRNIAIHTVQLGIVLIYIAIANHVKFHPRPSSLDGFLATFGGVLVIAIGNSWLNPKPEEAESDIMCREQTEETKGWMQMAFLLYHVWHTNGVYYFIRVLVSAFLWLTGFGHAAFFERKGDFGVKRLATVVFRMNFLVLLLMVITENRYVLYYVCVLHTLMFLLVTLFMYAGNLLEITWEWKVIMFSTLSVMLWDLPHVFKLFSVPLTWIVSTLQEDPLHEFHFRTHLDHLIVPFGMMVGISVRKLAAYGKTMSSLQIFIAGLACWVPWLIIISLVDDKFHYNSLHPYISFLPVTGIWIMRNVHPSIQSRHVSILLWIGRRSLELYLLQFHLFLGTSAHGILVLLPGFPATNFLLKAVLFVGAAHLCHEAVIVITGQVFKRPPFLLLIFGLVIGVAGALLLVQHRLLALELSFMMGAIAGALSMQRASQSPKVMMQTE